MFSVSQKKNGFKTNIPNYYKQTRQTEKNDALKKYLNFVFQRNH